MVLNTKTIVERITDRMDVDRIFMAEYDFLNVTRNHLLIVMNPISGISPKIMTPIVELCLIDQPDVSFEIVIFGDWKNKLSTGSVFYAYLSLPEHRLFASDRKSSKDLTIKELKSIVTLFEQVKKRLESQADGFKEGSQQFVEQANYLKATFMLHQSMQMNLSVLQAFVLGRINKVPQLANILKTLSSHIPLLKTHFIDAEIFDHEVLSLIDRSYGAIKKNDDLEITEETFDYLHQTWAMLQVEIHKLYRATLNKLQQEIEKRESVQEATKEAAVKSAAPLGTETNNMVLEDFSSYPWPKPYQDDVNALIDHIQKNHNPEKIILLNYRTGGFSGQSISGQPEEKEVNDSKIEVFLLVLMKRRGPITYRDITIGNASTIALFVEVNKLTQYLQNDQSAKHRFFVNTLQKGTIVRQKKTFITNFEIAAIDWVRQHENAKYYFAAGYNQLGILEKLINSVKPNGNDVDNFLLGTLVEKSIEMFLRLHIGFVPRDLKLGQLVDFTSSVDPRIQERLIPRSKIEENAMRNIINYKEIWHRCLVLEPVLPMEKTPTQFAAGWLDFTHQICIEALEYMEGQTK